MSGQEDSSLKVESHPMFKFNLKKMSTLKTEEISISKLPIVEEEPDVTINKMIK